MRLRNREKRRPAKESASAAERQPRAGRLAKSPEVEIGTRRNRQAARGRIVVRAVLHLPTLKQTASGMTKDSARDLGDCSEKAVVLWARAVGDAQAARSTQGGARPHRDPGPGEGLDDRSLVEVAELHPREVRLGLGGGKAHLVERVLDVDPLDQVLLDAVGNVVGVTDRLGGSGLGEGVDAEGLADRVDRRAKLR